MKSLNRRGIDACKVAVQLPLLADFGLGPCCSRFGHLVLFGWAGCLVFEQVLLVFFVVPVPAVGFLRLAPRFCSARRLSVGFSSSPAGCSPPVFSSCVFPCLAVCSYAGPLLSSSVGRSFPMLALLAVCLLCRPFGSSPASCPKAAFPVASIAVFPA
ncbi:hypothetical protein M5K25_024583 [Dendrobium thyrsiflorum]|uniref:Transmembrane protein n=1 Tax=Dendrobium thyrsiflorum TaxID=117978 RepID=A0ABD0U2M7_DENTH